MVNIHAKLEKSLNIGCLRKSNGGEFVSNKFISTFCTVNGIKRQYFALYTQQNGVVERRNRTILDMV